MKRILLLATVLAALVAFSPVVSSGTADDVCGGGETLSLVSSAEACSGGGGLWGVWCHHTWDPVYGGPLNHMDGLYTDGRYEHFDGWYC